MNSTFGQRARRFVPFAALLTALFVFTAPATASTYTITPGGAPVTATTDTVDEKATLKFEGTEGQRVSVGVDDVTIGTSGCCSAKLSILKPDGTTLKAAAYFGRSGAFFDTKTLPVDGQYKIVIDPQGTAKGSATVTLYDVPPNLNVPIAADGSPESASLTTPGQNATFPFTGTAGQRVSLKLSGVTVGPAQVSIVSPDGSKLLSPASVGTADSFFGPKTIPANGTYKVVYNPNNDNTGDVTVTLFDVPADATGTLVPGVAQTVTIATPAQNARLTFDGTDGQRISLELTDVTIGSSPGSGVKVSVRKPDGTTLVSDLTLGTLGGFIDAKVLPVNGAYKVVVNPQGEATGDITVTLHDVPENESGELEFGTPHVFTIDTPGQNSVHTFVGAAGDRISLDVSDVSISLAQVSVIKPNGDKLIFPTSVNTVGAFFDTKTLPSSGTYKVLLNPTDAATGEATLTVYDVPPDVNGDLVIGDPAETFTLGTPGQNAEITFVGGAGQDVTLDLSAVTIGTSGCCSAYVTVFEPDNEKALNKQFFGTNGASFDFTLDEAGTYRIVFDGYLDGTGDVTAGLSLTPAP